MKLHDHRNQAYQPKNVSYFALLCAPLLLFPVVYFPYALWGRARFVTLVEQLLFRQAPNPLRLLFTGNNTILLFWMIITGVVMLISLVIGVCRVRPWYYIILYLAVMFSLCGILSLSFYTLIVR